MTAPICPVCQDLINQQTQLVPGYQFVHELGRGTMGKVTLALRLADGALVAVKTIAPATAGRPADRARFLRDARLLGRLHHPHLVNVHAVGDVNHLFYIAMEYVNGTDAGKLLKEHGPLPVKRAVRLICQALEAVEYLHGRQLMHGDITPNNLLIKQETGQDFVQLADAGIKRLYEGSSLSGLTLTANLRGELAFLPPEQLLHFREVGLAADQYAAAATLYNLLTSRFVFDLPIMIEEQIVAVVENDPVPIRTRRPDLPATLAEHIDRALAKDPAARFQDISMLRHALLPFGA